MVCCFFCGYSIAKVISLEASISQTQVEWFRTQLATAMQTGKPIFLICHQALYGSNGVSYNPDSEKNWGIDRASDAIEAILRETVPDYGAPVFFISGHLHRSFDANTVDDSFCENLHCVTLPSVTKTADGGLGMSMEVYADRILLKAKNFITMEETETYTFPLSVPIK